ncbi:acyl-ACP--UDP-N-acetylglucosamine O-acyltransferase [Chamaesiphon sp.]|uniref:acyl-ACP--UDP-N-acetylglucosamine O-acyltransferase n=1 Tax=Chamaesiphon sp. TaxID=2814140 RepID=UPI003593364C
MAGVAMLMTRIHPTAVVHPSAELDPTVQIGPYAIIGENVTIGAGTTVGAHAIIEGPTIIGVGNQIFPGAAIGLDSQDLKYKGGETWVKIGNYNRIREYVTINRATGIGEATTIGNHNLLMAYVHVAHNCTIEDNVKIANATSLAGDVYVESEAVISGVLGIHQFVRVGRLSMIGGMTRIQRDVPPFTIVEGTPARVRSLNLVGLERASFAPAEIAILKKAFRTLYYSHKTIGQAIDDLDLFPSYDSVQHLQRFLKLSIEGKKDCNRRGPIPGKSVDNKSD